MRKVLVNRPDFAIYQNFLWEVKIKFSFIIRNIINFAFMNIYIYFYSFFFLEFHSFCYYRFTLKIEPLKFDNKIFHIYYLSCFRCKEDFYKTTEKPNLSAISKQILNATYTIKYSQRSKSLSVSLVFFLLSIHKILT